MVAEDKALSGGYSVVDICHVNGSDDPCCADYADCIKCTGFESIHKQADHAISRLGTNDRACLHTGGDFSQCGRESTGHTTRGGRQTGGKSPLNATCYHDEGCGESTGHAAGGQWP